jgi:hypothetical protein
MANMLIAWLALAVALQASPAPVGAPDAEAVLAAVLAQEAAVRGPEGGAQTCVVGRLLGPPTPPGGESAMALDRSVRISFQWHVAAPAAVVRPPPPPDGAGRRQRRRIEPVPPPAPLAPDLAARLDALRDEAAGAAPAGIAQVGEAAVPAPLHLQRANEDCALLTLSSPAFAGNAAFVEVAYVCGTVCGNGSLYALERREGRWQIAGVADIWIR